MAVVAIKPDNVQKESKLIRADTCQELLARVITAYHLEHVPSHLEVQIWSEHNRYRLDLVEKFKTPEYLFGYVRICPRKTASTTFGAHHRV